MGGSSIRGTDLDHPRFAVPVPQRLGDLGSQLWQRTAHSAPAASVEAAVYRPYALLAFGAVVCLGAPLGIRALGAHYASTVGVGLPWVMLHGHVQIFGFLGTLIVGIAPHLLARFTGRPVPARPAYAGVVFLALALVLRVAGTATYAGSFSLVAAALEAVVFGALTVRVWRALAPPPLARLRRHLASASAWLAVATLAELVVRVSAAVRGVEGPSSADLHELHALALFGGVLGWVLGVLLRAGPMFVAGWTPPSALAAAVPWLLGAGALLAAGGERGHGLFARAGELLVLATATAVVVGAGAFRRVEGALPLVGRAGDESRLFKLAIVSLVIATGGALVNVVAAAADTSIAGLPDAVLHLLTVGTFGGIAIAMIFRLIPVLEGRPLPVPGVRRVALVMLAGAVVVRTAQIVTPLGGRGLGLVIMLSGVFAWIAFLCVALTLLLLAVSSAPDDEGV